VTAWELGEQDQQRLEARGWRTQRASARTGAGVQEAFYALASAIAEG
jgi:hypothetical protein